MRKIDFDIAQMRQKTIAITLAGLLGLSMVSNLILLGSRDDQLVVLMPGEMSGPWEITARRYDERYLGDAGISLAETYLETTPATAEWRRQAILRWVHPAAVQNIAEQIDRETENIRNQELSSAFAIREVATQLAGNAAMTRVVGTLTRFVTNKQFSQDAIVLVVEWRRDERGAATVHNITWRKLEKNEKATDF